jgi:tetratricopeptide (TPR) repeat protein
MAVQDNDRAIELEPECLDAYINRGLAQHFLGNYKQAIEDDERAMAIRPEAAVPFNNRGYAHQALGRLEEAKADYLHAIELEPNHPNAHKNLAWLMATCPDDQYRDGAAAVEHARRAMELTDWKQADWLPILAAACAEAGDFDAAIEWQSKALDKLGEHADGGQRQRLEDYRARRPCRAESVST